MKGVLSYLAEAYFQSSIFCSLDNRRALDRRSDIPIRASISNSCMNQLQYFYKHKRLVHYIRRNVYNLHRVRNELTQRFYRVATILCKQLLQLAPLALKVYGRRHFIRSTSLNLVRWLASMKLVYELNIWMVVLIFMLDYKCRLDATYANWRIHILEKRTKSKR